MIQEGKESIAATGGNSMYPNTTHPFLLFLFFFSRIKSFKSELHEVTQQIQEPALLKECAIKLHQKFVLKKVETGELDIEITKEYARQQEYLEKSVEALKRRLTRDSGSPCVRRVLRVVSNTSQETDTLPGWVGLCQYHRSIHPLVQEL